MKNMGRGTPKDLREVVYQILTVPFNRSEHFGPLIIKDFLSQKFGAAMMAHPECGNVLEELFKQIMLIPEPAKKDGDE